MRSRTVYQCLLITLTTLLVNIQIATAREAIAETVTYYHYDGLGSTIAATDDNGELLWHEDYLPYGKRFTREDDGRNTLWFTGKPHEDKLGLSYFGARWYSPTIGRFTGIDPVGVDPENVHSFNRYAYANNNPYKYIDPDGNLPVFAIALFALKELAGEGFEQATGLPAPTVKGIGKRLGRELLSRSAVKGVGAKKAPIVIGENMKDRVIPTAKRIGAEYYKPRKTKGDLLKKDIRWLNKKMREGRQVFDIGPDPKRFKRSEFYRDEQLRIKTENYPVTRLNIDD